MRSAWRTSGAKPVRDTAQKNTDLRIPHNYNVWNRMKAFFEHPPEHTFKQGDLVTCTCHNRVAIIVHLYDDHEDVPMNMAKIWWISKPDKYSTNLWLHTIARLKKYELNLTEVESEVE